VGRQDDPNIRRKQQLQRLTIAAKNTAGRVEKSTNGVERSFKPQMVTIHRLLDPPIDTIHGLLEAAAGAAGEAR
jgi:hypothetical protein